MTNLAHYSVTQKEAPITLHIKTQDSHLIYGSAVNSMVRRKFQWFALSMELCISYKFFIVERIYLDRFSLVSFLALTMTRRESKLEMIKMSSDHCIAFVRFVVQSQGFVAETENKRQKMISLSKNRTTQIPFAFMQFQITLKQTNQVHWEPAAATDPEGHIQDLEATRGLIFDWKRCRSPV